jgi:hypothetical protein
MAAFHHRTKAHGIRVAHENPEKELYERKAHAEAKAGEWTICQAIGRLAYNVAVGITVPPTTLNTVVIHISKLFIRSCTNFTSIDSTVLFGSLDHRPHFADKGT